VWTNSWLSIAGAGCGLTGVGAGEEQARKVVAGEASRCGEDKYASFEGPGGQRGQVRAAWWHEQEDEVMDSFLVEPQNQGRAGTMWEPSHEWRLAEATRVRGVSGGSLENHWVPWLIHKAKTEEPKTVLQQCQTGLTGGSDRSDR
jgi:hypothetical protein